MKYQDNFPTIWDTPSKTSPKTAKPKTINQAPAEKRLLPIKEAFFSIWDTPKRQPNA
ncbi:MAG: hypothetical protein XD36_1953 [Halomonas sp. 54_146]|nr:MULTISPECIES: hypothetical protein [unclassified Halomonas]KUJ87681.1 MAG: hypothetical protein XD36_1953 [Halomonas sp. 54_146]